ncbi:MAG: hypothetical protein J6I73_06455 [Treponema sp.]|nr:hypothetical protein [Treponema sp.]
MNATRGVYVPAAPLSNGANASFLREGASVHVRVISQTGAQSYVVSFAGQRFAVASKLPLASGTTFTATVSFQNGKIALTPEKGGLLLSDAPLVQTLSTELRADGNIANPQLSAYFTALGLVPDFITLALFNGIKELGIKFDARIFAEARRIAMRFPGREKEAGETALVVLQKGLCVSEEAVAALIDDEQRDACGSQRDDAYDRHAQRKDKNAYGNSQDGGTRDDSVQDDTIQNDSECVDTGSNKTAVLLDEIMREVQHFLQSNNASDGMLAACERAPGFLTLFNHAHAASGHDFAVRVIQIPFVISLSGGEKQGHGVLRCFLEKKQHTAQKFAIKVDFSDKKYCFVIYVREETCTVRYAVDHSGSTAFGSTHRLADMMQKSLGGKKVDVICDDFSALSGFCFEHEAVSIVQGSV